MKSEWANETKSACIDCKKPEVKVVKIKTADKPKSSKVGDKELLVANSIDAATDEEKVEKKVKKVKTTDAAIDEEKVEKKVKKAKLA